MTAAREAAAAYAAAGWRIVPVPVGAKAPTEHAWPSRVFSPEQIATGNVGVILGPVSGHLCDVDLDSHWSLRLAPHFLPPTLTFGRASKPRSHWLYTSQGVRSRRLSFLREGRAECVEIRAQNASNDDCGHQSVFPGSTHPSGEQVCWDAGGADEPAIIPAGELAWRVARLAVASMICEGHQPGQQRNNRARAYAGGLLAAGWTADEVTGLFDAVFDATEVEPDQRSKDADAVRRTVEAFARGDRVTGFGSLVLEGLVDEKLIRAIERHARTPDRILAEAKLARSSMGVEARERIITEARLTDGLGEADAITQSLMAAAAPQPTEPGATKLGQIVDFTAPPKKLDWVCQGLMLAPGKISAVAGYAGLGKGPFLDAFALSVASGKAFLGHPVRRTRVVLLDFETGFLLEERMRRLAHGLGVDLLELHNEEWLTVLHAAAPLDDEKMALLDSALEPGSLLIVDSYLSATLGKEQRDAAYSACAFQLGALSVRKNVCVVAAMHDRKSQQFKSSDLEQVSGHNALVAALQTAIRLTRRDEKESNEITVSCARSPVERFKSFKIEWEDVPDPALPTGATPGERARGGVWGLRPVASTLAPVYEKTKQVERERVEQTADIAQFEASILETLRAHYPVSQATVRDLLRAVSSRKRFAAEIAIRNLVQRGAVLANHHWQASSASASKTIWLPRPDAEVGVKQT